MWGIPSFRLPEEALDDARRALEELCVKMIMGFEVGGAGAFRELLESGYDACFVSTGLSYSAGLEVLSGYSNAVTAAEFLRAAKEGEEWPALRGGNVVVIGGGSVAMDSAVTARRLGAKSVAVVVRRDLASLRADIEEIDLAHREHVIFHPSSQITSAEGDGHGRVVRLLGTEVEWHTSDAASLSPQAKPVVGTEFGLKADLVIQAIGSGPDDGVGELAPDVARGPGGALSVDDGGFTGAPGIFAGGDVVRGGGTIAEAVGDGRRAAESIHGYVSVRRARK